MKFNQIHCLPSPPPQHTTCCIKHKKPTPKRPLYGRTWRKEDEEREECIWHWIVSTSPSFDSVMRERVQQHAAKCRKSHQCDHSNNRPRYQRHSFAHLSWLISNDMAETLIRRSNLFDASCSYNNIHCLSLLSKHLIHPQLATTRS